MSMWWERKKCVMMLAVSYFIKAITDTLGGITSHHYKCGMFPTHVHFSQYRNSWPAITTINYQPHVHNSTNKSENVLLKDAES